MLYFLIDVLYFHTYCFNIFPFIKDVINKLFNLNRVSQKVWVNKIYAIKPISSKGSITLDKLSTFVQLNHYEVQIIFNNVRRELPKKHKNYQQNSF